MASTSIVEGLAAAGHSRTGANDAPSVRAHAADRASPTALALTTKTARRETIPTVSD